MTLNKAIVAFLLGLTIQSCSPEKQESDSGLPPSMEQEYLQTRNPETGEVETYKLWDYLLSKKSFLGERSLAKSIVYPNTWRGIDDKFASLAVTRIVYNPKNKDEMYFSTGEGWFNADATRGAGIWKSVDGGASWDILPSTRFDSFHYCQDLLIHPETEDLYVCTRDAGVLRSSDGGNSWQKVLGLGQGASSDRAADIELTASNKIFVTMGVFDTDGIYFSETGDPGSWERRMSGFPSSIFRIELATAPSKDSVAYAIPINTANERRIAGVYKTLNMGETWEEIALPGGDYNMARKQGWYNLILQVHPEDANFVLAGGLNLWRTRDGGETWQQLAEGDKRKKDTVLQYVHVDQHEIVFYNSDTVLFGNDGGIYRCDNIMADTPFLYTLNSNYNITQFYAADIEWSSGGDFIIGGTQDNGSLGSTDKGISPYRQLSWADGSYCAINHNDANIFYTTTQYRRMYRTAYGVVDTLTNPYIENDNTLFINPIEMDPNNPDILYQLSNLGLWRLPDARNADSMDWTKACRSFGAFSAFAISEEPKNVAFIGRPSSGRVYRINNVHETDDQFTPKNISTGNELPDEGYCSSVDAFNLDANKVVLSYSNYGLESVWISRNALADNPSWQSLDGNLPDIPVRWAEFHPTNENIIYLGTEAGVFYTNEVDGENTVWEETNEGFPNVRVTTIRIRPSDLTLVASTHGRGLWEGKIQEDASIVWKERGPNNVGGRTRTILPDPNIPGKVWAGGVSGGLWVAQNMDSINTYFEVEEPLKEISSAIVYPNPSAGVFKIRTVKSASEEVRVYDGLGKLIWEDLNYDNEQIIHSSGWRSGIYFVVIGKGEERIVKRVLIL
jgi:hypothetical protein